MNGEKMTDYPAAWIDHLCDVIEHPRHADSWGSRQGAFRWALRQVERDLRGHLPCPALKAAAVQAVTACAWAEGVALDEQQMRLLGLAPAAHDAKGIRL
jgi:hypothetical protein